MPTISPRLPYAAAEAPLSAGVIFSPEEPALRRRVCNKAKDYIDGAQASESP